uniref:CSON002624 protein n=1 Tax=Culicoides sonorensis TaxID=179676 RepID=A0A336MVZ4_CULSO
MLIRSFLLYLGLCLSLLIESIAMQFAPLVNCYGNIFYCENVTNYPIDAIRSAVSRKQEKIDIFFGADVIEERSAVELMNRNAGFEEPSLCDAEKLVIYPQSGYTIDGNFSYIINDRENNYIQGIAIERCTKRSENSQCSFTEAIPNGYESKCIQQYSYRHLLSYENRDVVKKAFKLPSHCKCTIQQSRYGI